MLISMVVIAMLPVVMPDILNAVIDLENSTYKRKIVFQIEYFVDQDEYFIYLFMHFFISCLLNYFTTAGACTIFLLSIYYVIGAFNELG